MLEEVAQSGSFEVHPVAKETSHADLFVKTEVSIYKKKKKKKSKESYWENSRKNR